MIKSIEVGGKEIQHNSCTTEKVYILSKRFDEALCSRSSAMDIGEGKHIELRVSLTHIKIIKFLNDADSVKICEGQPTKEGRKVTELIMENSEYVVAVYIFGE